MKGIRTALLCLLLLCGCGGRAVTAAEALAELAEHCDVPYALGSPLAESEDMWSGQVGGLPAHPGLGLLQPGK